MKCPYCNKPLQPTLRQSDEYWCENYDCSETNIKWVGSKELWQELTKTKQALDVAVDALIHLGNDAYDIDEHIFIENTLDQIKQITETKD